MNREGPLAPAYTSEMAKALDWIDLFTPQEIIKDFVFEKLVEESGIYRIYIVEKEDLDHIHRS